MGHAHREAAGPMGEDVNSMKYLLDALKDHCKPRSNEIVAATAYKQLVQGDLSLPEYIQKMQRSHSSMQLWHSI